MLRVSTRAWDKYNEVSARARDVNSVFGGNWLRR